MCHLAARRLRSHPCEQVTERLRGIGLPHSQKRVRFAAESADDMHDGEQ